MAIDAITKDHGGNFNNAAITTASVIFTAGRLYRLLAFTQWSGGGDPGAPTPSGTGSWANLADVVYGSNRRIDYLYWLGDGSTGTVTLTYGQQDDEINYILDEFSGTAPSTIFGTAVPNSGTGTTASVTLAGFADPTNNACDFICAIGGVGGTITQKSGFTKLQEHDGSSFYVASEWRLGEDTAPNMTWGVSVGWGAIGVEIKAPTAAGGPIVLDLAHRATHQTVMAM